MALGPYYIDGSIGGTGGAGSSGDPYRSWSDFLTGAAQSLSGHGEVIVYMKNRCTVGNTGSNNFNCSGWTNQSDSDYLHFKPWPGFEGDGTISGTPGWTEAADSYQYCFDVLEKSHITRLSVENTSTSTLGAGAIRPSGGKIVLDGVIAKAEDVAFAYGVGSVLTNCIGIVTSSGATAFDANESYGSYTLTNCTAINTSSGGTAYDTSGLGNTTTAINCVAYGSFTTEWSSGGTWHTDSGYNSGQIASGSQPTAIQDNYSQLSSSPFDALSEPYSPASGGALDGTGTATGAPSTDGLGATRPSPPSRGWLEVQAGDVDIAINVGSITFTTYVPIISIQSGPIDIPIGVGAVAFTTYDLVDTTGGSQEVFPNVGSAVITTYAETLGFGFGIPTSVDPGEFFPDDSALGIIGHILTVNETHIKPMLDGSVVITTYDLIVSTSQGTFIAVDVGSITSTGYAPEDISSHVPSPEVNSLTISTYVPLIGTSHVRTPDTSSLTITGYDVSISAEGNTFISIDSGSVTTGSSVPTLVFDIGRHPDTGSITITSYTPDAITEDVSWEFFPDQGETVFTSYDLTLDIVEVNKIFNIGAGSLVIPGYKVLFGTVITGATGGGRDRRKLIGMLRR